MKKDARNPFEDDVFAWQVTKAGKLMISWQGKVITTIIGQRARKLIERIERSDRVEVQHLLAKATGNFKRGNER